MSKATVKVPAPDGVYTATDFQADTKVEITVRQGRAEVPEGDVAAVVRSFPGTVVVTRAETGPATKLSTPEGDRNASNPLH